jgi:exodeoxyribonuclease V gamma subunit
VIRYRATWPGSRSCGAGCASGSAGRIPVQRLAATLDDLRADPTKTSLPERLSLFGPTALPARQFRVLTALAEHRDVHLWLPHPSPALWTTLAGRPDPQGPVRRRADPSATAPRHPLLSSLGRDAREMQTTLSRAPHSDVHLRADRPAATLLATLQRTITENERPGPPTHLLDEADTSIQVHACHGPARQVDVLRDVLVGLLADDATLQPSDTGRLAPGASPVRVRR